jgi:hypothetical protein
MMPEKKEERRKKEQRRIKEDNMLLLLLPTARVWYHSVSTFWSSHRLHDRAKQQACQRPSGRFLRRG